jgi:tRNA dimethylallyltransferase
MVKTLIVIVGPTAIGKTALAVQIAQKFQTEIISADSRQFYIETEIGTAKPSSVELAAAKHHFINSHHITENFTVGDFETQSLAKLNEIFEKNDFAVLVGGSGLYINAVCNGFDDLPRASAELRAQLNQDFLDEGIEPLQRRLQELDPLYFKEVDLHNPQRIIRALEVCISTGIPFSTYRTRSQKTRAFFCVKIGLNTNRGQLYDRINKRVDQMIAMGLEDEAKNLMPYRHLNALNTVGYSELFDYFDGKITRNEAIEKIKQNTRRFAKRQLTWVRKDLEINWFEPSESFNKTQQILLNLPSINWEP